MAFKTRINPYRPVDRGPVGAEGEEVGVGEPTFGDYAEWGLTVLLVVLMSPVILVAMPFALIGWVAHRYIVSMPETEATFGDS